MAWTRTASFALVVYGAPTLLGAAVAALLDDGHGLPATLAALAVPVALVGAVWLTIVIRRHPAPDVPALALSAAATGFGAAALVGVLLPVVGAIADGSILGGAYGGLLGAMLGPVGYLLVAGPVWLAASALCAARIILPARAAFSPGGRSGIVALVAGAVTAVTVIGLTAAHALRGSPFDRCTATGSEPPLEVYMGEDVVPESVQAERSLSWLPLGLRCVWQVGAVAHTHEPNWLATIVVVWALAGIAFGAAMLIRSRRVRERSPHEAAWNAPEDPFATV